MGTRVKKTFTTQAEAILDFYRHLRPDFDMEDGISIMNPYADAATMEVATKFYRKFYKDAKPRVFIFGINPGRHGAGVTGVPFTDPIRLESACGIPNEWKKRAELSSEFVYRMIEGYGGVREFYGRFYITAMSPLGFMRHGKNLNYYDDKGLIRAFEPFMLACIRRQLETMPAMDIGYCMGEGENFKYFRKVNERHGFFRKIIPLPHPRWVMQYRRKRIGEYIDLYLQRFAEGG